MLVNNINVYNKYGVSVTDDGYEELLEYPPLKTVNYNDWAEHDGVEPDLSGVVLDCSTFSVKFSCDGEFSNAQLFVKLLLNSVYNTFYFEEIGVTYRLRLTGQSDISVYKGLGFFKLKFSNDFPLDGYSYLCPNANSVSEEVSLSYKYIDDGEMVTVKNNLSVYGLRLLDGFEAEIKDIGDIKERLLRDISTLPGVVYDSSSSIKLSSREIAIPLLLLCSKDDFWSRYNALLYDVSRPLEHTLSYDGVDYSFYYNSAGVSSFAVVDDGASLWCEFNLVLTIYS